MAAVAVNSLAAQSKMRLASCCDNAPCFACHEPAFAWVGVVWQRSPYIDRKKLMKNTRHVMTLVMLSACGGMSSPDVGSMSAGELGATPGGAQDIGAARQMLAQGMLPSSDMLTYQGIFSEHDLAFTNPEPCLEGRTQRCSPRSERGRRPNRASSIVSA